MQVASTSSIGCALRHNISSRIDDVQPGNVRRPNLTLILDAEPLRNLVGMAFGNGVAMLNVFDDPMQPKSMRHTAAALIPKRRKIVTQAHGARFVRLPVLIDRCVSHALPSLRAFFRV